MRRLARDVSCPRRIKNEKRKRVSPEKNIPKNQDRKIFSLLQVGVVMKFTIHGDATLLRYDKTPSSSTIYLPVAARLFLFDVTALYFLHFRNRICERCSSPFHYYEMWEVFPFHVSVLSWLLRHNDQCNRSTPVPALRQDAYKCTPMFKWFALFREAK